MSRAAFFFSPLSALSLMKRRRGSLACASPLLRWWNLGLPKWLHIWLAGSFEAYGETLKVFVTLPRVPAYKLNTNTHTGPFSGPSSVCTSPLCHALFTFNQMSDVVVPLSYTKEWALHASLITKQKIDRGPCCLSSISTEPRGMSSGFARQFLVPEFVKNVCAHMCARICVC